MTSASSTTTTSRPSAARALGLLAVVLLVGAFVGWPEAAAQAADRFTVGSWNLESGDSDIATLTRYLGSAPEARRVQLWGLSEVHPDWDRDIEGALRTHGDFRMILGDTGRADRLAIVFDNAAFAVMDVGEEHHINTTGYARAPLWAQVRNRASGRQLLFMVNHLYRSREEERHLQARLLNEWGARQQLPIIAVGDYNFDWHRSRGGRDHDLGYDLMTANNVFRWIRPQELRRTQCGSRYQLVLDFVFVAGAAKRWGGRSTIGAGNPAYCPGNRDNASSSDHRPVFADFTIR